MGTKMSYSKCTVMLKGMSMDCPLCGTAVASGQKHECQNGKPIQTIDVPKRKPKAIKA